MKRTSDTRIDAKPLGLAGLLLVATLSLAACNTIEGVGEDTQSAGEALEDAANSAR